MTDQEKAQALDECEALVGELRHEVKTLETRLAQVTAERNAATAHLAKMMAEAGR